MFALKQYRSIIKLEWHKLTKNYNVSLERRDKPRIRKKKQP